MFKVILRSSEAISVVLNHYLSEKDLNIKTSGEIMIEQDTMEVATEIFQILLDKNLLSIADVGFLKEETNSEEEQEDPVEVNEENKAPAQENDVSHDTRTIKDKVFDYICEISPKRVTIKEVAKNVGIKYQAAWSALGKLYFTGKVEKDEENKYFKNLSSAESVEEVITEEQDNTEEVLTPPTLVEKAKAMQEVFSDENNKDILNYIFFKRKNNFEVKKIVATFGHAREEQISEIISLLEGKEIISFNEKLPPSGRYVIHPIGRIYANLLNNKEPMEEGALRTAVEIGVKEFQSLIEEALKADTIKKTVEKRVTRYAML